MAGVSRRCPRRQTAVSSLSSAELARMRRGLDQDDELRQVAGRRSQADIAAVLARHKPGSASTRIHGSHREEKNASVTLKGSRAGSRGGGRPAAADAGSKTFRDHWLGRNRGVVQAFRPERQAPSSTPDRASA